MWNSQKDFSEVRSAVREAKRIKVAVHDDFHGRTAFFFLKVSKLVAFRFLSELEAEGRPPPNVTVVDGFCKLWPGGG